MSNKQSGLSTDPSVQSDQTAATYARHCMNPWCQGAEWFSINGKDMSDTAPCPSCGYPSSRKRLPELTVDDMMKSLVSGSVARRD